jgi:YD repeat-containing protein
VIPKVDYDSAGRISSVPNAVGNQTVTAYDSRGNKVYEENPSSAKMN